MPLQSDRWSFLPLETAHEGQPATLLSLLDDILIVGVHALSVERRRMLVLAHSHGVTFGGRPSLNRRFFNMPIVYSDAFHGLSPHAGARKLERVVATKTSRSLGQVHVFLEAATSARGLLQHAPQRHIARDLRGLLRKVSPLRRLQRLETASDRWKSSSEGHRDHVGASPLFLQCCTSLFIEQILFFGKFNRQLTPCCQIYTRRPYTDYLVEYALLLRVQSAEGRLRYVVLMLCHG